jgi:flagellar protein FlgJ
MKRPPGTTVNVGGDKDPFTIEAAKGQAKVFSDIAAAGSTASRNLQNVKRLENTLDRVETGGTAAFKQFAGNFGIKTEGLDDIQAATAIINKLVPEQRAPGSGPMSDADLELFKQSLPRIINTPGGNKKIVEGLKEINNYIVKEAKIANDVLSKKITPEEGRNKLLELGDPVQDFFERNQGASPGSPRTQLPQADQDLINRYLRR